MKIKLKELLDKKNIEYLEHNHGVDIYISNRIIIIDYDKKKFLVKNRSKGRKVYVKMDEARLAITILNNLKEK